MLLAGTLAAGSPAAGDSMLARRLVWEALDRYAELDLDSAAILLAAARRADPGYFPAHAHSIGLASQLGQLVELRREYQAMDDTRAALRDCLVRVTRSPYVDPDLATVLLDLRKRGRSSDCSVAFLPVAMDTRRPQSVWLPRAVAAIPDVRRLRLAVASFWLNAALMLQQAGDWTEARRVTQEGVRYSRHPAERISLYTQLAELAVAAGELAEADAMFLAAQVAAGRDGRPGIRANHLRYARQFLVQRHGARLAGEAASWSLVRLARERGAWAHEAMTLRAIAASRLDVGDPAAAIEPLTRAVSIADSAANPVARLLTHAARGRAFAKLARFREAETDLLTAIAAGRTVDEPYDLADAYHNLAHVYEGMGRTMEALRAADQMVEAARPLRFASLRMMSLHDAGTIRWKAGLHAAANTAFQEMVRVIDEHEDDRYWAGEFFERSGDLRRASRYYRLGLERPGSDDRLDVSRLSGGLVRVFEELGLIDSAEAAARMHDAAFGSWVPTDVPLMPGVLARRGRLGAAADLARRWRDRYRRQGNAQGAALASLQLADLLLRWGRPAAAVAEAAAAESTASVANLTDERVEALRLRGIAYAVQGRLDRSLAALQAAVALARRHPTATSLLESNVALGDALAGVGTDADALAAYDAAARVVERVTERLTEDLDRARFRERHLAPFDGALRLLLRGAGGRAGVERVLLWSQRRKAAALALATGAGPYQPLAADLGALRERLAADEALVDYVVLDSVVAAAVVTQSQASVFILSVSPDSLAAMVDQLRGPLERVYAGQLDLERATYDLRLAHALYERLLSPLEPALASARRLLISPDGVLNHVPFEALVTRRPRGAARGAAGYFEAAYVVDRRAVEYLPAAQFLENDVLRRVGLDGRESLLALAHGAPGSGEEVESIRVAWRGPVRVLSGRTATETAVRIRMPRFQLLHVATHAVADDRDVLSSHLRLEPDAENDGLLQPSEIMSEPLAAGLVVLSGCQTATGRLFRGEGMMGLARSFLVSGAEAVLATRWPLGSSAAELMGDFYRGLAAGRTPGMALRDAQLATRRDPTTAHPFYWAAFELIAGRAPHRHGAPLPAITIGPGVTN